MIKWILRGLLVIALWNYLELPSFSCQWGGENGEFLIIRKEELSLDEKKEVTGSRNELSDKIREITSPQYIRQVVESCTEWLEDRVQIGEDTLEKTKPPC